MAAAKLAYRREHGTFEVQQAQRLAQQGAVKTNAHVDLLRVLNNRSYVALAVDTTITAAAYAPFLTANILTILDRGFLIITFTASGRKLTALGTAYFQVLLDGVAFKGCASTIPVANYVFCVSLVVRVAVTKGPHVVQVQWKTDTNSLSIAPIVSIEDHAHLLVQEAA